MSMPSDVNPDVAEAVQAMETAVPRADAASRSLLRRVSPEQYGFAAAVLVAFFGVAICGPKLREMRKPRHRRSVDRVGRATDRAVRQARRQGRDVQDEAARRMKRLRETLPGGAR